MDRLFRVLKLSAGFVILQALLLDILVDFAGSREVASFIHRSPWMFLYYVPLGAMFAWCLPDRSSSSDVRSGS